MPTLPVLGSVVDALGRGLDDLRISVIDRCNFRCTFCMPADQKYTFLPKKELLSFEEITRLATLFAGFGVRKVRLTGGEPLLRRDLEVLVEMLAEIPGIEDIALTTNGELLEKKAEALKAAGLTRVTVSVESLKDEVFGKINGLGKPVGPVLAGIEAAAAAGLGPIKINTVVMKGINDGEIGELAGYFKERGHEVRFIEFMDVGTLNEWDKSSVVNAQEILDRLQSTFDLEPIPRDRQSDVALQYRHRDDDLRVGIISSISQPFCGDCTRARLTSEGALYTCLFGKDGLDLKVPLRDGASDQQISDLIRACWAERTDRYSEERAELLSTGNALAPKIEMFRIGG